MADPTQEELEKMTTLEHALKYIGVNNALPNAIKETMGDLTQFKQVVLCPAATWEAAVQQLRVVQVEAVPEVGPQGVQGQQGYVPGTARVERVDRPPNVLEASQVVMLRRVSRLRLNQPAEEVPAPGGGGGAQQAQQAQAPPGNSSSAPPGVSTKEHSGARISEVCDQSDHAEVAPWSQTRVREALKVFKQGNKGVACKTKYTPSALQLAALEYKLRTQGSAYVDFGVWRPNAGRLEKRMRLTIHHRNSKGDWIPFEIAGPASFVEWQAGWRVFCVAMRCMDEADQPVLDEFERTVEELNDIFGESCWWIVAQGEGRMRSEKMPRMMDQALEDHEEATAKSAIHPWTPAAHGTTSS